MKKFFRFVGRGSKDHRRVIVERKGYGDNWYRQRHKALVRDDYRCGYCGCRGKQIGGPCRISVHHKRKIVFFVDSRTGEVDYEKANDLSNLIVACDRCHKIKDGHAKNPMGGF